MQTAYLDTCIVSGLAKPDTSVSDQEAFVNILRAHKAGKAKLVTSALTKQEIDRIPPEFRTPHAAIYLLIAEISAAAD
jgi:hypothetical protein